MVRRESDLDLRVLVFGTGLNIKLELVSCIFGSRLGLSDRKFKAEPCSAGANN